MNDIDNIREYIKVQRKYANFFEWYRREKSIKEKGIVEILISSLSEDSNIKYQNLQISENDPPDIIAESSIGELVGFEVRELVDQTAIELNEKGEEVYRDWTNDELIQEIQKIINEKDQKEYIGGPFEKLILVIPTDEPVLTYGQLLPVLKSHSFSEMTQLDEVYLLFSYDAGSNGYPYIQLKFNANNSLKRDAAKSSRAP